MEDVKSEERFLHLLSKHEKVFVDVYTSFCGPCKKLLPRLEELSKKFPKIYFCKVNAQTFPFISEGREDSNTKPISTVPTLLLFQKEKEVGRVQGNNISEIEKLLTSN